MIEEQFVSFEVAKLLKEIGFNIPVNTSYSEDKKSEYNMLPDNFNKFQDKFSRPTQALAARWLCEHKMIEVSTAYYRLEKSWFYWVGYLDCKDEDIIFGSNYASRQYAMEAGLQEAIKLIKNKEFR